MEGYSDPSESRNRHTSVRKKGYRLEKGDILLPQDISDQLNFPVYLNPDSTSTQLDAKHGMERQDPVPAPLSRS